MYQTALGLLLLGGSFVPAETSVAFNRDVRPILSDTCFHCHGPDKARRKGNLRLDQPEEIARLVVAGHPERSELMARLLAEEPGRRMPPVASGRSLTKTQIEVVRRWIEQGAKWQPHWAFIPPARPAIPMTNATGRNAIDAFLLARLESEGLTFTIEADRPTLLRRFSLDLTGLPPTPDEVAAFVNDRSPDAVERVVDRLLASPRYGERMAIRWLEAGRFADTHGYQTDGERVMWRWRDWVIDAYNRNLPFDRFTVEQLAGDLLPKATLDQKIATGFNRNHRGNSEGGIIPEEYAVEYVADRVETTSTVWLGLTLGCARCHDHKYDPLPQKDFYRLFAYFNNIPEQGRAVKYGNSPPVIKAPTTAQRDHIARLDAAIAKATEKWRAVEPMLRQVNEKELASRPIDWLPGAELKARLALDGKAGTFEAGDFGFYDRFTIAALVKPEGDKGGPIVARTGETARADGWSLTLEPGNKLGVHLVKRWLDDAIHVESVQPLPAGQVSHVAMRYDGSRLASGVSLFVDGQPVRVVIKLDELNQSFQSKQPLRVGGGSAIVHDVRIHATALSDADIAILRVSRRVDEIAGNDKRGVFEQAKLEAYIREEAAPEPVRVALRDLRRVEAERAAFWEGVPTVMVMEEMPTPRTSHVLIRGQYDKPGEPVTAGTPTPLPARPGRADRLGLAEWLVDGRHPLTARVAVNRLWQQHFGVGLVKTVDDFGSQGDWPSHPELLDWLATEFVRVGWDVKAMHRLMVTSAAYRQSSRVTAEALTRDPENRLLARGPRLRLSAEMIRDQALAVSGLLVERTGGPSVRPYQPAGLWKDLTGTDEYVQDHGADLYRRGLYTFWKRTAAPPMLLTFDAAGREVCVVRESRTNTPLQALNLLNDVTFVEAARVLAGAVLETPGSDAERVERLVRRVLGRGPSATERDVLTAALVRNRGRFERDPDAARRLVAAGEFPRPTGLDEREWAALAMLASLVLNLDETLTRE